MFPREFEYKVVFKTILERESAFVNVLTEERHYDGVYNVQVLPTSIFKITEELPAVIIVVVDLSSCNGSESRPTLGSLADYAEEPERPERQEGQEEHEGERSNDAFKKLCLTFYLTEVGLCTMTGQQNYNVSDSFFKEGQDAMDSTMRPGCQDKLDEI